MVCIMLQMFRSIPQCYPVVNNDLNAKLSKKQFFINPHKCA